MELIKTRPEYFYREEIARIATALRAELDEQHRLCHVLERGGQDYTREWNQAAGLFRGYKMLADLLGWQ